MLKTFCICAIIVCCSAIGYLKSYQLKRRYQSLCTIKAALSDVKSRIVFFGYDIARALKSSGKHAKVEPLFLAAAENINKKGAQKAWNDAVKSCTEEMCLTEEDANILTQLSPRLGMTDCQGQIKNIDGVISLLDVSIADAKYNKDRYCSLYFGGGALVGVFLGLII